ncbi:MAG: hypothetical protein RL179_380 [Planctomycetota bacterium]
MFSSHPGKVEMLFNTIFVISLNFAADPLDDYQKVIKPLFQSRCYSCHGALKQNSKLRLDTAAFILAGAGKSKIITPGNPKGSELLSRVASMEESERMPPEGEPVTPAQIKAIERWIAAGAPSPENEKPETNPKDHWAFNPPSKAMTPANLNPVDFFLEEAWKKKKLVPQKTADKRTLLRRLYLDVIGLPPLESDYLSFVNDSSPDAYEKIVDKLLASQQYGERWGRHWLDIWRYTDWWGLGAELRNSQKHIWHFRDWAIESLNNNLPYDEMLRQMLAADELYPTDDKKLRATGFLARQYFKFNHNSWMEETVEHTFKAFMGLTINCVRCHDHKYDPVAQVEYYQLRAFFEPYQVRTDMVPGEGDFEKNGIPRVFDCNLEAPTWLFVRGDEKNPKKDKSIPPGIPEFLKTASFKIEPVNLPPEAHSPELKPVAMENARLLAKSKIEAAAKALSTAEEALKQAKKPEDKPLLEKKLASARQGLELANLEEKNIEPRWLATKAKIMEPMGAETKTKATLASKAEKQTALAKATLDILNAEVELLSAAKGKEDAAKKKLEAATKAQEVAKKNIDTPGEVFTPIKGSLKTLESNLESEASRSKPYPKTSTGRRAALARWIADKSNPLTARVAVNHIWARHFGRPLVDTVFDFGRKGALPSHPELLDWLAADFMQNNWDMKKLHRVMLVSRAYQMGSSTLGLDQNIAADPDNKLLWHMNPRRLEAQAIRDSMLQLAGKLDATIGGPSIPPASQNDSNRRALYFFQSHNDHNIFLMQFDDANVLECYKREESILPQQALTLSNSKIAWSMAEAIHAQLQVKLSQAPDKEFIQAAFRLLLGSEPNEAEVAECLKVVTALNSVGTAKQNTPGSARARLLLVHSLLNHNDFVTVR